MPLFGKIVVIKRNGTDGTHFPLTANICLFGRKKECDIRIQLPQVSKEHCKIEVNENKEATLINLSTVNPTQLNGSFFEHPTNLKHGDLLTIIDRSFRFEYPPLSLPRKRLSRSQEKETLQVLHVQQGEQEQLLHSQNSEYKSLQTPDKPEKDGQNTNGSNKQRTQECSIKQYESPKSTSKIGRSNIQNEMSPFSKLYELMKHEGKTKTAEDLSNETSTEQQEYSPQKDIISLEAASQKPHRRSAAGQTKETSTEQREYSPQKDIILLEAASQKPRRRSAAGQTKGTEAVIWEKNEYPGESKNQGIKSGVCNQISVEGNSSRRSSASLQTYVTTVEETDPLTIKYIKENQPEEVLTNDAVLRARKQSVKDFAESLEYLHSPRRSQKSKGQPTDTADVEIKANLTDTFESVENVLSTSKSERQSFKTYSSPYSREVRSSSKATQIESNSLLGLEISTETTAETEQGSMHSISGEYESEKKYLKINGDEVLATEEPLDAHILKEMKNKICVSEMQKDESSGMTVASLCYRRSPRRSIKQNKDFSHGSSFTEMLTKEELLVTSTHASPGKSQMQTPSQLPEENIAKDCPQENNKIKGGSATKSQKQNFEMKKMQGSSSLPENSAQVPPEEEAVSEMHVSSPFGIKRASGGKKSPKKRKARELELLDQPLGKRKRVSFGSHLSPELFDKRLPPNSPLKRGAIPARLSLPFENSPRAVLKKASGVRQSVLKSFFEKKQHENIVPQKAASPLAHRSPAISPSLDLPSRRGRFSVSHVISPPSSIEEDPVAGDKHINKDFIKEKTPEPSEQELKPSSVKKSKKIAPKRTSLHRRSGAMGAIQSKRRSGASEANLIVSRSWAEVVKQGALKSQLRTTTNRGFERSTKKIPAKQPKNNVSVFKTPTRKVKGHFTTGHANSPAPIVIGKAHTNVVSGAAQVPKVMINYPLKQPCDVNESFTGMAEMFNSPPNWKRRSSRLSSVHKTNMPPEEEISELHTPEESGEMTLSPLNIPSPKRCHQNVASPFLREIPPVSSLTEDKLQVTPEGENTAIQKIARKSSSLVTAVNEAKVGVQDKRKSPKQDLNLSESLSEVKEILRTPIQETEVADELSGIKRLMRTPKQKIEAAETLSGVKRLMRTPKQKIEAAEALSGIKRLMRTPKQKMEADEVLSGVKRLMRTPMQEAESAEAPLEANTLMNIPVQEAGAGEAPSVAKTLMRTPVQEVEIDETLSEVMRTPMQQAEADKILSGVKRLKRTPKQKTEADKTLSGIRRLTSTPKQKMEADKVLSEVKMLLRTPKQEVEAAEVPSAAKRSSRTPKQEVEIAKALSGVKVLMRTPMQEVEASEVPSATKRSLRTPKQEVEIAEALSGVKTLMRTPMQEAEASEVPSAAKRSSRTPKQEVEIAKALSGVTTLMSTPMQEAEASEVPSATKRSLRTPKQEVEIAEALSGVKTLMSTPMQEAEASEVPSAAKRSSRTPKQEVEIAKALSGVKVLMRTPVHEVEADEAPSAAKRQSDTPQQDVEAAEVPSATKRSLRTAKQEVEIAKALSGVTMLMSTPMQEAEASEVPSATKRSLRTPKQEVEIAEALSGIKTLMRTPMQEAEADEALSAAKRQSKTPKQDVEAAEASFVAKTLKQEVEAAEAPLTAKRHTRTQSKIEAIRDEIACSTFLKSPDKMLEEVMGSVTKKKQKQRKRFMGELGINQVIKVLKGKEQPLEDMEGIQRLTLKQKSEPLEDIVGISQLLKTPKQRFMQFDDYLGLQKLMAEPKQSSLSPEIDYTGVKEMLDTVDGYKQETKLEASFERKSPFAIPRNDSKNELKLEDNFGQVIFSCLNEVKVETDVETNKIVCAPESFLDGMDLQNVARMVSVKKPAAKQRNPATINVEMLEPLSSIRRTRRGNINKSTFAGEHNTKMTQSCAKLTNCMQTNENFDQNVTEKCVAQGSEMTKSSSRRTSRKNAAKTHGSMESVDISQTQEIMETLTETPVKIQLPVNRKRVAAERHGKTEASLDLEDTAATQENGSCQITKTYVTSRNRKGKKKEPELMSELIKLNPQDNMQNKNLETSRDYTGNNLLKRNTRRRKAMPVQTDTETLSTAVGDKSGSLELTAPKLHKTEILESGSLEAQENPVTRGKGKKVHFVVENENSDASVLGDEGSAQEEKRNAFLETCTPTNENILRRSKRKAAAGTSLSTRKHTIAEICEDKLEDNIHFSLENPALAKENPSAVSFSLAQGKGLQVIQNKDKSNETQKVSLENEPTPAEQHSPPKRQKVRKENPSRRGRSRQNNSHETSTDNDCKQAADTKGQDTIVTVKENPSRRGKGKRTVTVPLPLENITLEKAGPSIDNSTSDQEKCSLQEFKIEESPNEAQNMSLENAQAPAEHRTSKRQKVTQASLRRGRSKQVIPHETFSEYDTKEEANTKDQNMVVKNTFLIKENQSKKGRKITPAYPFKNEISSLPPATKNVEQQQFTLETAAVPNENLPRRGRRRKTENTFAESSVSASKKSRLLDNGNQEKVVLQPLAKDLQSVTKDTVSKRGRRKVIPCEMSTASNGQLGDDNEVTPVKVKNVPLKNIGNEGQPKISRRGGNVHASQVPPSLKVSITLPSSASGKLPSETTSENQSTLEESDAIGGTLAKCNRRNNKIVPHSKSARRKCKHPEEETFQEKHNVDLEKTSVSDDKPHRRGRRNVDGPEATVSLREKCRLTVGASTKDHTVSAMKDYLGDNQQKVNKRKRLPKNMDQSNISNNQKNDLELSALPLEKQSSKRGRRKQVNNELEISATSCDSKKSLLPENKPAEDIESTIMRKGRRKTKEEQTKVMTEPAAEIKSKTRASRRTRKEIL
ncbi:proliferation marker protein Ki-67 [Hemicordylus capensis]|uniref:proliferation marker protein Ki-67 n=1 Tax=Hemicordylus capensis TaxID=884348 RepID=UPI002303CA17|nr:proliferation marker protein Ki-67 [Hemicordylus capensis]XP_053166022.1 proliferation marker protein Ki-67 [Hemicordylus capensis]